MMHDPLDLAAPQASRPAPGPGWMITFADLLSLLLSFFVLLFATTTIDHRDWTRVMEPVTVYFGGRPASVPGLALTPPAPAAIPLPADYLGAALRQLIAQDPSLAGAQVSEEDHRTILALPTTLLACRGMRPGIRVFDGLATLLANVDDRVTVVGHSGIDPTAAIGPASWLAALATADRIAASLTAAGATRPIVRAGRADLPGGSGACAADIVFDERARGGAGGG